MSLYVERMRVRMDGQKLRAQREMAGHKQESVAEALEISERTVRAAEAGQAVLYEDTALPLARLFGCDPDDLIVERIPVVTFIDANNADQDELFEASFDCYAKLFPDPGERDDPEDIRQWIERARQAERRRDPRHASPWKEVYAVFHTDRDVVGMAYFSGHTKHKLWFGNFFGIVQGQPRRNDRAATFLETYIFPKLEREIPGSKAILFEIEPIEVDCLINAVEREQLELTLKENLQFNINAYARLRFYNLNGAVAALGEDHVPLPYWQPAMQLPLSRENERAMVLMAYTLNPDTQLDISACVDFLYDDVYRYAYDGTGGVELPGYVSYLAQLKRQVIRGIAGVRFGAYQPTEAQRKALRPLFRKAKEWGLWRGDEN